MKKKFSVCILTPILFAVCFTSCNKDNKLNQIDESKAIIIAKSILDRQRREDFKLPSWFTYKYNYYCSYSSKLYETGTSYTSTKIYNETQFNLDDLIIKEVYEVYENDYSNVRETYLYFDDTNNQLVTLSNNNGKKTKSVEDMRHKDYAIMRFKNIRDEFEMSEDDDLVYFEDNLKEIKVKKEKIKDKTDQYINMYFGSNDEKSMQFIKDQKLEKSETHPLIIDSYILKGYETLNTNYIYKDDLTNTKNITYSKDIKNNDNGFYIEDYVKQETSYKYGKVKITLPNVNEYKLSEN